MNKEYLEAFELVKRTCELYIQSASHLIGADIIGNKIDEAVDTIKQALLKAQEPKHYLKWEDLEFEENKLKKLKVKMGTHVYTLEYQSYKDSKDNLIDVAELWYDQRPIVRDLGKYIFNDLHLERVEE